MVFDDWYQITWGEQHLIRPFSGIPNNYPNYEIQEMGLLRIGFTEDNPFFGKGMNFYIPLAEDISPYGVGSAELSVAYDFAGQIMPGASLFTVRVNLRDKPAVSARINGQLKTWTDGFPGTGAEVRMLEDFVKWYTASIRGGEDLGEWTYRLQPVVYLWRDYLSVSYILQLFDGPAIGMPMFRTICFDVNTGNAVDLAGALPRDLDYEKASAFERADFTEVSDWGWFRQERMPDGYVPAAGSVITDAWIMYGTPNIYVTEPDGRVLQFNFWEED